MLDALTAQQVAAVTAAVTAAVGGVAVMRRRLSRDRTEITKDRVESEFLKVLLKERDEALANAREAWQARHVDAESIARLTAQNVYQQAEIERLKHDFAAFKRLIARLSPSLRAFMESEFGAPPDLKPETPPAPPQAAE
jgi:hypothetical protein